MLAHVAQEGQHVNGAQPVGVVDDASGVGGGGEIEKALELGADPQHVGIDLACRQQVTLLRLAAGVANHAGTATDNGNRRVA